MKKVFLMILALSVFACTAKKSGSTNAKAVGTETAESIDMAQIIANVDVSKEETNAASVNETIEVVPPVVLQKIDDTAILAKINEQYLQTTELYVFRKSAVLYEDETSKSKAIAALAKNTVAKILETGKTETINEQEKQWVKVLTMNNEIGWCFSDSLKQAETSAKAIVAGIENRKPGSFASYVKYEEFETDLGKLLKQIDEQQGFYIQQAGRVFQGGGRVPDILKLSVENERVFVSKIDVVDGEVLEYRKIEFTKGKNGYAHNDSSIKSCNNQIVIFYLEDMPENSWLGDWDYTGAYTFASASDVLHPSVFALTTDYLKLFTGEYVFDSLEILKEENRSVDVDKIQQNKITIQYVDTKKCLMCPYSQLETPYEDAKNFSFVETSPKEPFFWIFGESTGYHEKIFWFYNGGIACMEDWTDVDFDENHEVTANIRRKYVVFYKRSSKQ